MEDIINNYDQMVSEIVNNYNDQIYQIMWYNKNTVEIMNLYINDLENRFNNLNNNKCEAARNQLQNRCDINHEYSLFIGQFYKEFPCHLINESEQVHFLNVFMDS